MMTSWKLNIFVRAILIRIATENKQAYEIIDEYPSLTIEEKTEILNKINNT